jgi:surface polysaccharide O-acyltransferase-like enzyme
MNLKPLDNKKIIEITSLNRQWTNQLRGIAILGVMIIHVTAFQTLNISSYSIAPEYAFTFLNQLSRFSVPFFFILSGMGLEMSHKFSSSYFEFLKSRCKKLIPPYLIWTIIYWAAYSLSGGREVTIRVMVNDLIFGKASAQLYYIPLLLVMYVFYPLIRRIVTYKYGLISMLIMTIISQIDNQYLGSHLSFLSTINIVSWLIYFAFGITIARNKKVSLPSTLFLITSAVLSILFNYGLVIYFSIFLPRLSNGIMGTVKPSVILQSFAMFYLFCRLKPHRVLVLFGEFSFPIFLGHILVQDVLKKTLSLIGISRDSVTGVTLLLLLVPTISLISCMLYRKILVKRRDIKMRNVSIDERRNEERYAVCENS